MTAIVQVIEFTSSYMVNSIIQWHIQEFSKRGVRVVSYPAPSNAKSEKGSAQMCIRPVSPVQLASSLSLREKGKGRPGTHCMRMRHVFHIFYRKSVHKSTDCTCSRTEKVYRSSIRRATCLAHALACIPRTAWNVSYNCTAVQRLP